MITLHFQQTYLNDIWRRVRKLNHGHVVRRPALSPLHRHCFLYIKDYLETCTNRTFVTSLMNHLMIWIEWQFNKDFNTSAESFYCFVFLSKILNPSMYKLTYTPPPPPPPHRDTRGGGDGPSGITICFITAKQIYIRNPWASATRWYQFL